MISLDLLYFFSSTVFDASSFSSESSNRGVNKVEIYRIYYRIYLRFIHIYLNLHKFS
jgi:transposase